MQPGPSPLLGLVAVLSAALGQWGAPPSSGRKLDLVADSLETLGGHCREQREACATAVQTAARSPPAPEPTPPPAPAPVSLSCPEPAAPECVACPGPEEGDTTGEGATNFLGPLEAHLPLTSVNASMVATMKHGSMTLASRETKINTDDKRRGGVGGK